MGLKSVVNPLSSAGHLRAAIANVTTHSGKAEQRASVMIEKLRAAEFVSETDIDNIEYNLRGAQTAVDEALRMLGVFGERYLVGR